MKIRNNKNLTQKIIIAIVIVISFNFIAPNYSHADIGGVLLGPVIDMLAGICDSVIVLLQVCMSGTENITSDSMPFKNSSWMVDSDKFDASEYHMAWDTAPSEGQLTVIDAKELDHGWLGIGTYTIPVIKYSPEKIFSNKVPALDANFISPKTEGYTQEQQSKSIAISLRNTISSWYNALRNLVIVGLLSVLVYVGIRMMLTSIASDKAKYKQMLMDWFIALCLVFFLHYIMSFTMTIIDMITEGIGGSLDGVYVRIVEDDRNIDYKTDLTGLCRQQIEYEDLGVRLVYLIFYIGLTVYTFVFTWKYMKRAITMAFLTLMAPLVTLTYPLDKMGDGKAQAFNMWIKEYVFNALLQPFHLIVYTIFLGASMSIAIDNPLYAILFLAFITPAEKILRKFFGFDKASTAGASFAGGFGGAAAFKLISNLASKGASRLAAGKSGGNGGNRGNNHIRQQTPVRDDNAPRGYGAFANGRGNNRQIGNGANRQEQTPQQAMIDANNERYGTSEYDPYLEETLVRNQDQGMQYTADELREQGMDENAIRAWMGAEQNDNSAQALNVAEASPQEELPRRTIRGVIGGALRYTGGAARGALRYTGESLRNRFATKEGWRKNGAFIGRAAVRTLTTGVGAAVGLGMGMAGDDLEDVFTYGAAGAALGGTALNNIVQGTGRRIANSGVVQAASAGAREAYHGGVNQAAIAQQANRIRSEGQLREYISNNITHDDGTRLSRAELNTYEDRAIEHYNAGVTDFSAIEKTLKLEDNIKTDLSTDTSLEENRRNEMARMQAQTIARIADDVSSDKLATDAKYRQGRRDDFSAGLLRANPQLSQREVKAQTEQMMQLLCKYKKVTYRKD